MVTFSTPVRGLVCNVGGLALNGKPDKSDKPDPDATHAPPYKMSPNTVEAARKNTEIAKQQEKVAIEKEKQQAMFTTAMDKGRDADEATKKALKYKPNSHQGKKAHHAAAVAHRDAHKHFSGVGGEKGGLMLDQRAACERKAAKHKKLAETHAAMAEGFGNGSGSIGGESERGKGPTKNMETGCPGVGVEIIDNSYALKAIGTKSPAGASKHAEAASSFAAKSPSHTAHTDAGMAHQAAGHSHYIASLKAKMSGDSAAQKYHTEQRVYHNQTSQTHFSEAERMV